MTTTSLPKYPHVEVELVGKDGNVFNLIGLVAQALREAGVDRFEIKGFTDAAMTSESYDAVLQLIMRTVNVS